MSRPKPKAIQFLLISLILGTWTFGGSTRVAAEGVASAPILRGHGATTAAGVAVKRTVPFARKDPGGAVTRAGVSPARADAPRALRFRRAPPPVDMGGAPGRTATSSATAVALTPPEGTAAGPPSAPRAPDLIRSFPGLVDDGRVIPPDTMGAAGPSHLVSILNSEVAVFDKVTGLIPASRQTLSEFWAPVTGPPNNLPDDTFDPKILWDPHSGRFVAVTLDCTVAPNSWILLAVSVSSDPTAGWNQWAIDADLDHIENNAVQTSNWADFPGLGVDNANIYITANMFDNTDRAQYEKVWVVPKAQLVVPAPSSLLTVTEFRNPPGTTAGNALQPAQVFGTAAAEYVVHEGYVSGADRLLRVASITFPGGPAGAAVWTDLGFIRVAGYPPSVPPAPQSGIVQRIDAGDTRLLNAVFRNGRLFTTHTVADPGGSRSEIAWYVLDPASAGLPPTPPGTPLQQGRTRDSVRSFYYPSIAVNANGDIALGFSGSSPGEFAGGFYTARRADDPPGVMQPPALLKGGEASYLKTFGGTVNRWGDFSATIVDPVDDTTFWTLQEYAETPFPNGESRWATWWGSFGPPVIAAPGSLTATALSVSQIGLTWVDTTGDESGFTIERKVGETGTFLEIASFGPGTTSFTDNALSAGVTYVYRVKAFNAAGSSYSNEASATTALPPSGGGGGGGCAAPGDRPDSEDASPLLTLLLYLSPPVLLLLRRLAFRPPRMLK